MTTEKYQHLIGKSGEVRIFEVERGAIKRYAYATDDDNPLYWDDEYAAASKHGDIIAPPGFFGWPCKFSGGMPFADRIIEETVEVLAAEGFTRILDGGIAYEFHRPAKAGDKLAALTKVSSVQEKEGKSSTMVMANLETTFTNQNGDLVAKQIKTVILR